MVSINSSGVSTSEKGQLMCLSPFVGLDGLLGLLVRVFVIVIFINAFSNFIGFHYCLLFVTTLLFSSTMLIL